jgi:hypothetical protein
MAVNQLEYPRQAFEVFWPLSWQESFLAWSFLILDHTEWPSTSYNTPSKLLKLLGHFLGSEAFNHDHDSSVIIQNGR